MNSILSSFFNLPKLLLFLFLMPSYSAFAEIKKEAISIQSDTLELNQEQGLAVYLGNVVLKQNGKALTADKLIIHRNSQGKLEKILAFGNPAKYVGTLKNDTVFGEANKITFLQSAQDMILEGQAKFVQKQDSFTAPYITYNFQNKIIRSKSQEGVRPIITFHPD